MAGVVIHELNATGSDRPVIIMNLEDKIEELKNYEALFDEEAEEVGEHLFSETSELPENISCVRWGPILNHGDMYEAIIWRQGVKIWVQRSTPESAYLRVTGGAQVLDHVLATTQALDAAIDKCVESYY